MPDTCSMTSSGGSSRPNSASGAGPAHRRSRSTGLSTTVRGVVGERLSARRDALRCRSASRSRGDADSKQSAAVLSRCDPDTIHLTGARRFWRDQALIILESADSTQFAYLFTLPSLTSLVNTLRWCRQLIELDYADEDALRIMRNVLRLHPVIYKVEGWRIRLVKGVVMGFCQALILRWTQRRSQFITERFTEEATTLILGIMGHYLLISDDYTPADRPELLLRPVDDADEEAARRYVDHIIGLTERREPVVAILTILTPLTVNGLDHHLIAFYLLKACGMVSKKPKCRARISEAEVMTTVQPQAPSEFVSELKLELRKMLGVRLYVYGSAFTGLGDVVSDTDICFLVQDFVKSTQAHNFVFLPYDVNAYAKDLSRSDSNKGRALAQTLCTMLKDKITALPMIQRSPVCVQTVVNARKPIITISNIQDGSSVDICIATDAVGICNSVLLKHYARMDSRFVALTILVKQWSKARLVNGAFRGHLSSYAITLTVLNFLIHAGVLSNIQMPTEVAESLHYHRSFRIDDETLALDPTHAGREDMPWSNYKSRNNDSVADLLRDYYSFMTHALDWNDDVVSPRSAPFVLKKSIFLRRKFKGRPRISGPQIGTADTLGMPTASSAATDDPALRLPFSNILGPRASPKHGPAWIYDHPDHQAFTEFCEQAQDACETALCIECPVENRRILSARSENASLFAELWRAWTCLTYDKEPVTKLCRPFPAPDNTCSGCSLRMNMWRQLPPFVIRHDQELTEAYAKYGNTAWASLERLENGLRHPLAPTRVSETPSIESICRAEQNNARDQVSYQRQRQDLEARAIAARANIELLSRIFPGQPPPADLIHAIQEYEAFESNAVENRGTAPGQGGVQTPPAADVGSGSRSIGNADHDMDQSRAAERAATEARALLALINPNFAQARPSPKAPPTDRGKRGYRGRGGSSRGRRSRGGDGVD